MEAERITERFNSLFPETMSLEEISRKLSTMEDDADVIELRSMFCNMLVYIITTGYIEYSATQDIASWENTRILLTNVRKLPKDYSFYWMMYSFYMKDYKGCLKYFDDGIENLQNVQENELDESWLIDTFIEPMKNAFPGFWSHAQKKLSRFCKNDGTADLCALMEKVYGRRDDEEGVDILTSFMQKYPDIICTKEYLGCLYMNLRKWNNAIAYFESVESPIVFANNHEGMYFMLAEAYGKIKDWKNEEKSYRKCLELKPTSQFSNNNLAYCLYKQKRYAEAKDILETCVKESIDMPYAANNYLRVLLALGRNKDAQSFIKTTKEKIAKGLVDKAKNLPATNERIVRKEEPIRENNDAEETPGRSFFEIKGQQFSTERILEEELTARIEGGIPVFGKNLKVYKRKGVYGRQFIIPIGRLDLLCEDDEGNLYIVELKKDSGYDDAYVQTAAYLDWFERNWKEHKKIHGIICLNNPSEELLKKVHADRRMKVFEYQVSYMER